MTLHAQSWILAAALVFVFAPTSLALQTPEGLDSLDEREQELLEAIAARGPQRREAALVASQHPDVLVRLELIQARSSAAFDLRVEQLDREHQEELWELVRTPGVLSEVVAGGKKTAAALAAIVEQQPEPVRDAIRHLGREHFELLRAIDGIKASADIEFGEAVAPLSEFAREAFAQLLEDPELLAMLARSPRALVVIGEAFGADPEATRARIDELATAVAAANRVVEEEWRDGLANDPEACAELEQAAREYAGEYGYDYEDLTSEPSRLRLRRDYAPYPYWFGYPRWYSYWNPWGYWYPVYPHVGFHYGPHRSPVSFGRPSLHFVHWFYGGHHHRYQRVARHFDHRRHRHHRSSHAVDRAVRRHDRHDQWRAHRRGSPETIRGRGFRPRERHRGASRESRRSEFRRRTLRMPDGVLGQRVERERRGRWRRAERRDRGRTERVERRDRGRTGRVARLPRVDAPRRHRGRSSPSRVTSRSAPRVTRTDVVDSPRVRSAGGGGSARVAPRSSPARPRARAGRSERSPRVERATRGSNTGSAVRTAKSRGGRSIAVQSKGRSSGAKRPRAVVGGGRSSRSDGASRVAGASSSRDGRSGGGRSGRGRRGHGGRH